MPFTVRVRGLDEGSERESARQLQNEDYSEEQGEWETIVSLCRNDH